VAFFGPEQSAKMKHKTSARGGGGVVVSLVIVGLVWCQR
jgi:hypothetical protein